MHTTTTSRACPATSKCAGPRVQVLVDCVSVDKALCNRLLQLRLNELDEEAEELEEPETR